MGTPALDRFLDDVRKNPGLLQELKGSLHDLDAAVRWADTKGYGLTREDLRELADRDRALSDDELEEAAGGDDAWGGGTGTGGSGTGGTTTGGG
jgi:predicted ribosomally synthesized peptide with nif11-like leader